MATDYKLLDKILQESDEKNGRWNDFGNDLGLGKQRVNPQQSAVLHYLQQDSNTEIPAWLQDGDCDGRN